MVLVVLPMVVIVGIILAIKHLLLHAYTHLGAAGNRVLAYTTTHDEFLLENSPHLQLRLRSLLRMQAARYSHFQHHLLLGQLLLLLLGQEMLLLLFLLELLHQYRLLLGSQLLLFLLTDPWRTRCRPIARHHVWADGSCRAELWTHHVIWRVLLHWGSSTSGCFFDKEIRWRLSWLRMLLLAT